MERENRILSFATKAAIYAFVITVLWVTALTLETYNSCGVC